MRKQKLPFPLIILIVVLLFSAYFLGKISTIGGISGSKGILKDYYRATQTNIDSSLLGKQLYPSEITKYSSSQQGEVVGMICSNSYGGSQINVEDEYLKTLKDKIKVGNNQMLGNFVFCQSADNKKFLEYGLADNNGNVKNMSANFAEVDGNGNINLITSIPEIDAWYNACNKPILLTNTGYLYFRCGGGDAGSSWTSIYKIDLNNKSYSKITECIHNEDQNGKILQDNCK